MAAPATLTAVVMAIAATTMWRLTSGYSNDIIPHAQLAAQYAEDGSLLTYSLWYPLIWVSTGGGQPESFRAASVALLVLLVAAKALVAYIIAQRFLAQPWSSAAIAFGVTVFAPLVDPMSPRDVYLGQITATVWHNSTNIAVAPFALLAFWMATRAVGSLSAQSAFLAGVTAALAIAVKPNFGVAMLPVFAVALCVGLARSRTDWRHGLRVLAGAGLPPVLVLAGQYASVYGGGLDRTESLTIAPFLVWSAYSSSIPWSILLSLAGVGTALVVLALRREISQALVLAWAVLGVAVVQMSLFAEMRADGSIEPSGNWFWGAYTALMVVALYSAIGVRDSLASARGRDRVLPIVAALALSAHVASGLYYALSLGTEFYGSY